MATTLSPRRSRTEVPDAWEAIDPGAYLDPDFLKTYEDQAKPMNLTAGEHSSPELAVIPSAKTGE